MPKSIWLYDLVVLSNDGHYEPWSLRLIVLPISISMDRCILIQLISKGLGDNSSETGEQRDSRRHMLLCNKCTTFHQ